LAFHIFYKADEKETIMRWQENDENKASFYLGLSKNGAIFSQEIKIFNTIPIW
jgi:hypothetical protein